MEKWKKLQFDRPIQFEQDFCDLSERIESNKSIVDERTSSKVEDEVNYL